MKVLMAMIPFGLKEGVRNLVSRRDSAFSRCKPAEVRSVTKELAALLKDSGLMTVVISEVEWADFLGIIRSVYPKFAADELLFTDCISKVLQVKEQLSQEIGTLFLEASANDGAVLVLPHDEEVLDGTE